VQKGPRTKFPLTGRWNGLECRGQTARLGNSNRQALGLIASQELLIEIGKRFDVFPGEEFVVSGSDSLKLKLSGEVGSAAFEQVLALSVFGNKNDSGQACRFVVPVLATFLQFPRP
jgi:hypothetical protein